MLSPLSSRLGVHLTFHSLGSLTPSASRCRLTLTWAPAALIIRPPHPHIPLHPAAHWQSLPTDGQLTPINLHIWSPLRRRQSGREREREREWGGGPVKLELAGIAVWSLLQPLPLKKTLFLCIAAPYSNNYFAFWSSCVVNLRGKWIQLPCKNKKSYYNDGHMGYGLMCRLVQITYHF